MDPAAVEALLEEEERKAKAKDEAKKKQKQQERLLSSTPEEASFGEARNGRSGRKYDGDVNRYSNDRDANDERRSRRSRELGDDEEMKDASDKGSANGSVPSRRRSRSPDPDRRGRHSSREHNSYRERDRLNNGGDFYRGGGRAPMNRNDNDSYRPGSGGGSGDRRRREERDHRSGGHARARSRDGKRATPPMPTDDERDRRTVFVQQLAARLRTKALKEFFEAVGPVEEAQIVKDRVSGRSKGVGYVEFKDEESVQKAIQLTGQKLLSIPIIVQLTEAEKNRQARNTEGTATQSNGIPFHRLYVGNIHFSVTEDDIKQVFEPFGDLEFVQLQKEQPEGRSKGYGFVQYVDPAQAKQALEQMNGFELAGRPIRVGLGNDKFTPESTTTLLQRFGSQAQQASVQGSSFSGMGGRGAHAGGTGNFDRASGRDGEKTGGASALDDTDVGGVNFSNYSRDALMRKLARTDEPEQKIVPKTTQQKPAPIDQPAPSRCVLLKNMYSQAEETDPNWQEDLIADVRSECQAKYGTVVHVGLTLDNNDGEIWIKFNSVKGGENAIHGLNGRYFGGRMITAQYVVDAVYNMNHPKAANL